MYGFGIRKCPLHKSKDPCLLCCLTDREAGSEYVALSFPISLIPLCCLHAMPILLRNHISVVSGTLTKLKYFLADGRRLNRLPRPHFVGFKEGG